MKNHDNFEKQKLIQELLVQYREFGISISKELRKLFDFIIKNSSEFHKIMLKQIQPISGPFQENPKTDTINFSTLSEIRKQAKNFNELNPNHNLEIDSDESESIKDLQSIMREHVSVRQPTPTKKQANFKYLLLSKKYRTDNSLKKGSGSWKYQKTLGSFQFSSKKQVKKRKMLENRLDTYQSENEELKKLLKYMKKQNKSLKNKIRKSYQQMREFENVQKQRASFKSPHDQKKGKSISHQAKIKSFQRKSTEKKIILSKSPQIQLKKTKKSGDYLSQALLTHLKKKKKNVTKCG